MVTNSLDFNKNALDVRNSHVPVNKGTGLTKQTQGSILAEVICGARRGIQP